MQLFKASRQWSSRPADERFWDLNELAAICKAYRDSSVTALVRYSDLRVEAEDQEMFLIGKQTGTRASISNWAFGQLSQRIKAPAEYLRNLPATLAAQNVNYGLAHACEGKDEKAMRLLLHKTDETQFLARCLTGTGYTRIWNFEIAQSLLRLQEHNGWRVAPARPAGIAGERTRIATEADVLAGNKLGLSVKVGDTIAPAGLYASDRDMFVFLIDDQHVIPNPLSPSAPLARGFFLWNSEVGDKTFGLTTFLYDAICGNHIVWGARDVREFRTRHVGTARERSFHRIRMDLIQYANSSISDEAGKIEKAQSFEIAAAKDNVIEKVMSFIGKKKLTLKEGEIVEAYAIAESNPRYGRPNSPWALTQGLTEISQRSTFASARTRIDRDAGKLLEIAF